MSLSLTKLRIVALSMLITVVVVAVIGIPGLHLNSHYSAYFDRDDPLLVDHQEISELYSRKDSVFVVLQSENSFLDVANYRLLEKLTADLAADRFASRVVSIPELGILGETATDDGDYIPSLKQLHDQGRAMGLLLADNTKLAGILVQIELPDNNSKAVVAAFDAVHQTVQSAIVDRPVSAHYTGTLALNNAYIRVVQHDLGRILPLLFVVMIIMLAWMMRSWRSIFAMLPVGVCSVVGAFGLVGLFGAELAAINSFTPIIIFTISIAGCVHMALSFNHFRDDAMPADNSALAAARYNFLPMALTNGTTALGFVGLAFSPSPPVRLMGYLVAVGVFISFILCLSLLPMLLARIDPWKPVARSGTNFVGQLARFVSLRRIWLIMASLVLALPAAWLASRNVISDNVFEYFSPSHPFSQDTRLVDQELSGINEIIYSVDSGRESGFFSAEAVEAVDKFSTWLRQQPEVNRVTSVADIDVLAEARSEHRLQQRLDFYRTRMDASAENNPLLSLEVSDDYSSSAVSAYLRPLNSNALVDFDRRALAWAKKSLAGYSVKSGGPTLMFAHLGQQNIHGMLTALTIALVVAAMVLALVFRSAHIAWIALVCNLLPLILVYSAWAVFDGRISIGAAVVTGMILGIVLDDTIYLLATYRHAVQHRIVDAVQYAMRRVGPALMVTTITLVSGLSLGLLSDFGPVWSMSVLSVTVIAVALLVDLLLLPALLLTVDASGDHP
jgi:predicted RND superfamily exporter protein